MADRGGKKGPPLGGRVVHESDSRGRACCLEKTTSNKGAATRWRPGWNHCGSMSRLGMQK
jgi:hypothetical protein